MTQTKQFRLDNLQNITVDKYDVNQFKQKIDQRRKKIFNPDLNLVKSEPKIIQYSELEQIKQLDDGRYSIRLSDEQYEIFFKRGAQGLCVTFDGSRIRGADLSPLPTFSRWSWHTRFEGSMLCFEDPMYYRHNDLKLGWFYGTCEVNFREHVVDIIKQFIRILKIELGDVVLYSSSGGGNVAAYCGCLLSGCSVVAINPQIILSEENNSAEFTRKTGIDLSSNDSFGRNNVSNLILTEKNTRFLFIFNSLSSNDFEVHCNALCNKLHITPQYGIVKRNNVAVWIYAGAGSPSTHVAYDYNTIFHSILYVIDNFEKIGSIEMDQLVLFITEMWGDYLSLKSEKYYALKEKDVQINELKKEKENIEKTIEKMRESSFEFR